MNISILNTIPNERPILRLRSRIKMGVRGVPLMRIRVRTITRRYGDTEPNRTTTDRALQQLLPKATGQNRLQRHLSWLELGHV
jgi:hypothetical protein